MNMPTNCPTCGDVVELDGMMPIGNELHCRDCYEDWEELK